MEHRSHGMGSKHLLIMLACCLIPVAGLGAAWFFGVSLGTLGIFALILFCLLAHLFLMRGMGHGVGQRPRGSAGRPSGGEPEEPAM